MLPSATVVCVEDEKSRREGGGEDDVRQGFVLSWLQLAGKHLCSNAPVLDSL